MSGDSSPGHGVPANFRVSPSVSSSVIYPLMQNFLGLHYQCRPYEEIKVVRCTRGAIFDVVVDIRPDSPNFCKWISVTLTGDNHKMLYVPGGFAHGFQTLHDNTEVFYQMSEYYYPEYSGGFRWDDPAFGIKWPLPCSCISQKDRSYKNLVIEKRDIYG